MENKHEGKAWVIAVSMGYGHQRTAYPLRDLSPDGNFINANDYDGIPKKDKDLWATSRSFYDFISRFKKVPVVGPFAFYVFDRFIRILSFYPRRDLSFPNWEIKRLFLLIRKGWGRDLIEKLKANPLPFISTFFAPAFMAEEFNYPGDIFCVVADADIARSWAPFKPADSRIKYCAPTSRVKERLKLYGVKEENIFLTGYPLPKENIGDDFKIVKKDIVKRISRLDPKAKYSVKYRSLLEDYLDEAPVPANIPPTVMFSVGGAGAQKEIGIAVAKSLKNKIKEGEIKLILAAGARKEVCDYFKKELADLALGDFLGDKIRIIAAGNIPDYFDEFNKALREADILWTKPSELSFYCALGIPIIIAPPIGSQEDFNREWLFKIGSAMDQRDPAYADEWLFDYLNDGWFAEAAMNGFIGAQNKGTFNIEKLVE